MEVIAKHFDELTTSELYEIYKLRNSVFIVEQACPYQDIDEADKSAYHIWLKDDDGIGAYLRILPKGVNFNEVSLGRVIAVKRHCGLGTRIVKEGINIAKERLNAECIVIEAQVYAKKLYENVGFVVNGDEFLEDNIPHVPMIYKYK